MSLNNATINSDINIEDLNLEHVLHENMNNSSIEPANIFENSRKHDSEELVPLDTGRAAVKCELSAKVSAQGDGELAVEVNGGICENSTDQRAARPERVLHCQSSGSLSQSTTRKMTDQSEPFNLGEVTLTSAGLRDIDAPSLDSTGVSGEKEALNQPSSEDESFSSLNDVSPSSKGDCLQHCPRPAPDRVSPGLPSASLNATSQGPQANYLLSTPTSPTGTTFTSELPALESPIAHIAGEPHTTTGSWTSARREKAQPMRGRRCESTVDSAYFESTNPSPSMQSLVALKCHQTSEDTPVKLDLRVTVKLPADSPEAVEASSSVIFSNFFAQRYRMEMSSSTATTPIVRSNEQQQPPPLEMQTSASTSISMTNPYEAHVLEELESLSRAEVGSLEERVAHNLALIGDEINQQYGERLDSMIKMFPEDQYPMDLFSNVASALFARGPTNWGQIVVLFYFGYRLVLRRLTQGILEAIKQVIQCLVNFCRKINIFLWIAEHGGWGLFQYIRAVFTQDTEISQSDSTACGLVAPADRFSSSRCPPSFDWSFDQMASLALVTGIVILLAGAISYLKSR